LCQTFPATGYHCPFTGTEIYLTAENMWNGLELGLELTGTSQITGVTITNTQACKIILLTAAMHYKK